MDQKLSRFQILLPPDKWDQTEDVTVPTKAIAYIHSRLCKHTKNAKWQKGGGGVRRCVKMPRLLHLQLPKVG